jgi:hypothetical protein
MRDFIVRCCRQPSPVTLSFLAAAAFFGSAHLVAQAPITPPPDHEVRRLGTTPEPPAPPALPPAEIIKRFSEKEDLYLAARPHYGYRKTIRIEEFDPQGQLAGQFLQVTETVRDSDGRISHKVLEHPQSTLRSFSLEPEEVRELERIPQFPLTTAQLAKYELKYLGEEQIDEIKCYIFQVKPKDLERTQAYFEGIVWADAKYLELVKTYGKWVTELGDTHIAGMPFTTYETYRENVDGKYWFPNYMRSDDMLHLRDANVPVRLVIKWTNFQPLPEVPLSRPAAPAPAQPPS